MCILLVTKLSCRTNYKRTTLAVIITCKTQTEWIVLRFCSNKSESVTYCDSIVLLRTTDSMILVPCWGGWEDDGGDGHAGAVDAPRRRWLVLGHCSIRSWIAASTSTSCADFCPFHWDHLCAEPTILSTYHQPEQIWLIMAGTER